MARALRWFKRQLVESPFITVSAVVGGVGIALPTYAYLTGGRAKEQRERFDLWREMKRDPRITTPSGIADSDDHSLRQYRQDRVAAGADDRSSSSSSSYRTRQ